MPSSAEGAGPRQVALLGAALLALVAGTASAELAVGDDAPDFTTEAAKAGETSRFSLADALARGPVVLYFYPAAFTPGCTLEAHEFAEATDDFAKLGATVIGVSRDDIDTLKRFSKSECRGKFAVAADTDGSISKSYDAVTLGVTRYASRTSYVITPDHKIVFVKSDPKPHDHVDDTMKALRAWTEAAAP